MLVLFYALSAVIGPFVGQNFAAGKEQRILRALWLCTLFALGSSVVYGLALGLLSGVIPGLFTDSEEVARVTRLFLLIVPVSYGAYGMVMIMNASFNGLGHPMPAVWISVARILVLYVPLALAGAALFGIPGVFGAYVVANVVSGLGAYAWARRSVRRLCAAAPT
jgi:Na+-driven multidrug efflux pump